MDFVIEQHSEFDEVKKAMTDHDYVLLSSNDYWNEFERSVSQSTITVYGIILKWIS